MAKLHTEATSQVSTPPLIGVGIGGGVREKLQHFLRILPAECGYAVVIAQSDGLVRDSRRLPLAIRESNMPVVEVKQRMLLRENHVYVPPPGKGLLFAEGHLEPVDIPYGRPSHSAINVLFRSLAGALGAQAVCVLLSARGDEGLLGLRTIKEKGGFTVAELPGTESQGENTVPAGLVDHFLPLRDIPVKIAEHLSFLKKLQQAGELPDEGLDFEKFHCEMSSLILARTGHDFSQYKPSTIRRRIQRRMQVMQVRTTREYLELLRKEEKEAERLFQDLLVGVTNFFRDPEAFDSFARMVVPAVCEGKGSEDVVRVWVLGCATGEEAYSVAVVFQEHLEKMEQPPGVQIFATDIDDQALDVARQGRYGEEIAEDVSAERLSKYFTRIQTGYQVSKDLRAMCIFSEHNLIADPPFSRLDLITCRNLLIYLNSTLQRKLVPLFHYALRPGGYLFLGPAENVLQDSDLFEKLDKKHRIFRSLETGPRPGFTFPISSGQRRRSGEPFSYIRLQERDLNVGELLDQFLHDHFTPPAVVINDLHEIVYFSGKTALFIAQPEGAPNLNLLQMVHNDLRLDLHSALQEVKQERRPVLRENLQVRQGETAQRMNLLVRELRPRSEPAGMFVVVFQPLGPPVRIPHTPVTEQERPASEADLGLDHELRMTRQHLDATIRELETSNEKLKLNNEELLSMNEELQSSNEELQMSQEELQSLNEELETLNGEMRKKVEELDAANSDLQNLFESTDIATIFVGDDLRIKRFTPATKSIFRLIDADHGRPVTDIVSRFTPMDLEAEIERVLRTLNTVEREVQGNAGEFWYMMRILPYRTIENVIDGVVITFTDVSRIKKAEREISRLNQDLQWRVSELETILNILPVGVMIAEDPQCERVVLNDAARRLTGITEHVRSLKPGLEHQSRHRVFRQGVELPRTERPLQLAAAEGIATEGEELLLQPVEGEPIEILASASPLLAEDGTVQGAVATFADVSNLNRAMREAERRAAQQNAVAALGVLALEHVPLDEIFHKAAVTVNTLLEMDCTKVLELLPDGEAFLLRAGVGWQPGVVGKTKLPNDDRSQSGYTLSVEQPVVVRDFSQETRFRPPELLTKHQIQSGITVIVGEFSAPLGVFGTHCKRPRPYTADDVSFVQAVANVLSSATYRQHQQDALALSEERYRLLVAAMTSIVWVRDPQGRFTTRHPSWEAYTGQTWEEYKDFGWKKVLHPEDRDRILSQWLVALEKKIPYTVEGRIFHAATGTYRYYQSRGVPLLDESGEVREWIGTVTDEDDRRRAELAIREREERYRAVGESFDYGVWMADAQGKYIFLSQSFADLLGTSVEYLHEHGWTAFMPEEEVEPMQQAWREALAAGNNWEYEFQVRDKDGGWHTLLTRGRAVRGAANQITAWAGVNFDITYRKRMQEERERLARVVDSSYDAIFTKTLDGTITSWNLGAENVYGYSAEEVIGKRVHIFAPENRQEELEGVMERLRAGEPLTDLETERVRKDGRHIFVSLRISPLHDEHGRVTAASVIARDVTERVQARESLQRMNEALEQRVQERTANLIKYQGRLRALLEELMVTEQRERRRISIEMHDYLAQLLVASRMKLEQARKSSAQEGAKLLEETDSVLKECITYTRTLIAELSPNVLYESGIDAALQWLARQMKEHGLEVEVKSHGKMLRLREDLEILIYQAVRELLINAAKHSGQQQAAVEVFWDPGRITLKVSDRGAGFDVNEQRILSETRKKFGLFNVAERIEASDGEFEISSHPGAGTEASISLPVKVYTSEPAEAPQGPPVKNAQAVRVLIADDHELVRRGLFRIINTSPEFEVIYEASNGEEAWEWALRLAPDVVLMDINMPRMNGIEATRRIKADVPEVQVVGLSLHDDTELSSAMLAAGAHQYLTKGGPPEELFAALRAAHAAKPVQG